MEYTTSDLPFPTLLVLGTRSSPGSFANYKPSKISPNKFSPSVKRARRWEASRIDVGHVGPQVHAENMVHVETKSWLLPLLHQGLSTILKGLQTFNPGKSY